MRFPRLTVASVYLRVPTRPENLLGRPPLYQLSAITLFGGERIH